MIDAHYGPTAFERAHLSRKPTERYQVPVWCYWVAYFSVLIGLMGMTVDALGFTDVRPAHAASAPMTNAQTCHVVLETHETVVGATWPQVVKYCKSIGVTN